MEAPIDDGRISEETRQQCEQHVEPIEQTGRLEPDVEARDDRRGRGHEIVHHDENLACAQPGYPDVHVPPTGSADLPLFLTGVWEAAPPRAFRWCPRAAQGLVDRR